MKFFIVGLHCSGKQEIIDTLEEEGVKCGRLFSNISQSSPNIYNSQNYNIYDDKDIKEIFENNAYVFIKDVYNSSNRCFEGLSLYDFDNNNVFCLSPDEMLAIPAQALNDTICFIWLDNTKADRINRYKTERRVYNFNDREAEETKNMNDFVDHLYSFPKSHRLYFCNEDPQRISAIIYSLIKHEDLINIYIKKFN